MVEANTDCCTVVEVLHTDIECSLTDDLHSSTQCLLVCPVWVSRFAYPEGIRICKPGSKTLPVRGLEESSVALSLHRFFRR